MQFGYLLLWVVLSANLMAMLIQSMSAKLGIADREAWYGDPDFVDVPLGELLDSAYADDRRSLVGYEASRELRPGAIGGRDPRLPPFPAAPADDSAGVGEPTVPRSGERYGDTTHIDVVDRHGNMVAATPSGGGCKARR